MRISIPIAAGGGRSNTRMPMPSASYAVPGEERDPQEDWFGEDEEEK